ncbi:MAG: two-component system, OmpR family, sensor kinase [Acidobacteriaceae bacterium]|jgi:signal transduction histidine kinase|nr:two-component system, OmpR family, sensor kinase [Acidobacteriaceae bacterium]
MMKSYSITHRLIATILLVELLAALAISGGALVYERHVRFRSFDVMLRGRADSLLGAVQDADDAQDNVMLDGTEVNVPGEDIYLVQGAGGRTLGRSANWMGPSGDLLTAKNGNMLRTSVRGKHYRVLMIEGLRIVDPGEKGGGIPRRVAIFYGSPIDHVWGEIWEAVGFYAITSLSLLAISGLLIFWLLNRGLAPLRELAAEASGVSVDSWDFVPPPRARMIKELAPLTVAIETVLAGLEQSFLQQRRFVSDAAHELKTAVAVLKSSLQLLTLKQRTAIEYERGIERSQLDCQRMEETVAKMLTLARVEANSVPVAVATDLTEVLRQVSQQFESIAELKRLQILVLAEEPVMVDIEPEQLQLLCGNLLLNALQHSPAGSTIRAVAKQDGTQAELAIEDDGEGIAAQDLPHVFNRFYRGDPSRSRNTGGTGLGLAICKAIASQWQGTIDIASNLGVGTRVMVRFPVSTLPSASFKLAVRN